MLKKSSTFAPKFNKLPYKSMTTAQKIARVAVGGIIVTGLTIAAALCQGCNVTRTITNESQYFQRGDTSVMIQTKTIETYDASRKK
jgi:hypothetical protein